MSNLTIATSIIYLTLGVIGFFYAQIIYLKPWRKTWLEVVTGSLLVIAGFLYLQIAILYSYGYLPRWAPIHIIGSFVAIGINQIYWQERKHNEGHKRAKVIVAKDHSTGGDKGK